jgi:membrane-bound inhibitor of C-type lysozyme
MSHLPDVISRGGSHWRTGNLTVWAAGERTFNKGIDQWPRNLPT